MVRVRIQDTQLPQPAHALRVFPTDIKTVPVCLSLSFEEKKGLLEARSKPIPIDRRSREKPFPPALRGAPINSNRRRRSRTLPERSRERGRRERKKREKLLERERERDDTAAMGLSVRKPLHEQVLRPHSDSMESFLQEGLWCRWRDMGRMCGRVQRDVL